MLVFVSVVDAVETKDFEIMQGRDVGERSRNLYLYICVYIFVYIYTNINIFTYIVYTFLRM
jgi:hypothetical protein